MGSKKSTTTTTRDVPEHIENASRQAVNLGSRIASRPYEAYGGDRFADLTDNERAGINLATDGGRDVTQYIDRAGQSLEDIRTLPETNLSAYMNPNTDAVESGVMRNLQTAAGRASRSAARMGDGSGELYAQSAIQKQNLRSVADASSSLRSKAFGDAINAWRGDQDMKLRASQAWRDTAGDVSRMNSQQIRDLMMTGEAARVVSQLDKDFDYFQYAEQRDWDINNLGPLLESLQVPYETTERSKTKTKGGLLGNVIGAGALIAGAMFAPATGGASLAAGASVAQNTAGG